MIHINVLFYMQEKFFGFTIFTKIEIKQFLLTIIIFATTAKLYFYLKLLR